MIKRLMVLYLLIFTTAFPAYAAHGRLTCNDNRNGTYKDEAALLEKGDKIKFNSTEELNSFLLYYFDEYRLKDYDVQYHSNTASDDISVYLIIPAPYSRDEYVKYIIDTFGYAQGNTDKEKIIDTLDKLKGFTYNFDYANRDLKECINDKQTVCWQLAKIAAVILQESGVNTRSVSGYTEGYHMWIITETDDGNRIYSDPVSYIFGYKYTCDIPAEEYNSRYTPRTQMEL